MSVTKICLSAGAAVLLPAAAAVGDGGAGRGEVHDPVALHSRAYTSHHIATTSAQRQRATAAAVRLFGAGGREWRGSPDPVHLCHARGRARPHRPACAPLAATVDVRARRATAHVGSGLLGWRRSTATSGALHLYTNGMCYSHSTPPTIC